MSVVPSGTAALLPTFTEGEQKLRAQPSSAVPQMPSSPAGLSGLTKSASVSMLPPLSVPKPPIQLLPLPPLFWIKLLVNTGTEAQGPLAIPEAAPLVFVLPQMMLLNNCGLDDSVLNIAPPA